MTRKRAFLRAGKGHMLRFIQQTVGLQFLPYVLIVISATAQASWAAMRDIFIKASEIYFSFLPSSFKCFSRVYSSVLKITSHSGGNPSDVIFVERPDISVVIYKTK